MYMSVGYIYHVTHHQVIRWFDLVWLVMLYGN